MSIKEEIFEKIKAYDRILITRHQRPDGDAMGSTLGLRAILRASFPEKDIRSLSVDKADYTAFLGADDPTDESFADGALCLALDCGDTRRLSGDFRDRCAETVKIDHHPNVDPYGDLNWVEDDRSSVCEMIVDFYNTFKDALVLTEEAAVCLYTGMVTDSLRFKIKDTKGETMRMAALLLDTGIDTETIFAHLGMDTPEKMAYKAWALRHIRYTENGVAYFYVSRRTAKRLNLSLEEISSGVSFMDSIAGSLIWLGFFQYDDASIRVRLRSRFTTVNGIASRYGGGGHPQASGATVHSKKEMKQLLAEADAELAEYKSKNEGWI